MRRHDEGTAGAWPRPRAPLRAAASSLALVVGLVCAPIEPARAAPPEPDCDPELAECEPEPEHPEPRTAGEWYARGYELGNAGDYDTAAEAFLRSYELQATSEALFNAALAYENADVAISAIETYERFLAEPERKEELVPAAERSIEALMRQIAVLRGLRYAPTRAPAELRVRGEQVELDAFPMMVLPGEIEIEVVDEHGVRARETYELFAGEALVVDLRALLPPPKPKLEPEPEPVVDSGPSAEELEVARARSRRALVLRKFTWAGVGLTGAAGVGALTLGLLANGQQRLFDQDSCYQFEDDTCPPEFSLGNPDFHARAYQRYARGAYILTGVTAGLAVTTLVVGLASRRYARQSRVFGGRARVRVVPGLGGLTLRF